MTSSPPNVTLPKDEVRLSVGSKLKNDDDGTDCTEDESFTASAAASSNRAASSSWEWSYLLGCLGHVRIAEDPPYLTKPPMTNLSVSTHSVPSAPDDRDTPASWSSLSTIGEDAVMRRPRTNTDDVLALIQASTFRVENNIHAESNEGKLPRRHSIGHSAVGLIDPDEDAKDVFNFFNSYNIFGDNDEPRKDEKKQDVATSLNKIGIALCRQGKAEDEVLATNAFEKSLRILQDSQGPGHEDCVLVLHNMWIMMHNLNERKREQLEKDQDSTGDNEDNSVDNDESTADNDNNAVDNENNVVVNENKDNNGDNSNVNESFYPYKLDSFLRK